jgi:hypothetical protein
MIHRVVDTVVGHTNYDIDRSKRAVLLLHFIKSLKDRGLRVTPYA